MFVPPPPRHRVAPALASCAVRLCSTREEQRWSRRASWKHALAGLLAGTGAVLVYGLHQHKVTGGHIRSLSPVVTKTDSVNLFDVETNKQHIVRRSELKMRINVRCRSLGAGQKYNIIDKSPPQKPPSDNAVHFQDSKNTMMKTMMWSILPFSFMWCFTFQ